MAEPYPVLFLELCQGSLNDIRSTMTLSFFVRAFDAASSALQTLEKLCIAHRDVVPSSFFIKGQQVLLGDFECAGTPAYWSAECWGALMKQAPHTPRPSDVYAFGQTFTELSEASGVRRWRNFDKLRKASRTLPEPGNLNLTSSTGDIQVPITGMDIRRSSGDTNHTLRVRDGQGVFEFRNRTFSCVNAGNPAKGTLVETQK